MFVGGRGGAEEKNIKRCYREVNIGQILWIGPIRVSSLARYDWRLLARLCNVCVVVCARECSGTVKRREEPARY